MHTLPSTWENRTGWEITTGKTGWEMEGCHQSSWCVCRCILVFGRLPLRAQAISQTRLSCELFACLSASSIFHSASLYKQFSNSQGYIVAGWDQLNSITMKPPVIVHVPNDRWRELQGLCSSFLSWSSKQQESWFVSMLRAVPEGRGI